MSWRLSPAELTARRLSDGDVEVNAWCPQGHQLLALAEVRGGMWKGLGVLHADGCARVEVAPGYFLWTAPQRIATLTTRRPTEGGISVRHITAIGTGTDAIAVAVATPDASLQEVYLLDMRDSRLLGPLDDLDATCVKLGLPPIREILSVEDYLERDR